MQVFRWIEGREKTQEVIVVWLPLDACRWLTHQTAVTWWDQMLLQSSFLATVLMESSLLLTKGRTCANFNPFCSIHYIKWDGMLCSLMANSKVYGIVRISHLKMWSCAFYSGMVRLFVPTKTVAPHSDSNGYNMQPWIGKKRRYATYFEVVEPGS